MRKDDPIKMARYHRLFQITLVFLLGVFVLVAHSQRGFGQHLWGDGAIIVNNFVGQDFASAVISGVGETGQGKWRPLTYILIGIVVSQFGSSANVWFLISACLMLLLLFQIFSLLHGLKRDLNATLPLGLLVALLVFNPGLSYSLAGPFGVMELGATICGVEAVRQSLNAIKGGTQRENYIGILAPGSWAFLATLFHERFIFLSLGIIFFFSVLLMSEIGSMRVDKLLRERNPTEQFNRVFRNTQLYFVYLRLRITGILVMLYLYFRLIIPGSSLVTTGGESGLSLGDIQWIPVRILVSLAATVSVYPTSIYFSRTPWLPDGIVVNLLFGSILLILFWTVIYCVRRRGFSICSRDEVLGLLTFGVFLAIPASMVRERIESRWLLFPAICLLVGLMLLAIEGAVKRHRFSYASVIFTCVLLWNTGLNGPVVSDEEYSPMRGVNSTLESFARDSVERPSYISIVGSPYSEEGTQWLFGYGTAFRLVELATDPRNFDYRPEILSEMECSSRVDCVRLSFGDNS